MGYNSANAETIKAHKRRWYSKAGGKAWAKLQREQHNFSGVRDQVIARDGGKCVRCGSDRSLCVHHRDGNGRGNPQPNNQTENLETLCRRCHMAAHRSDLHRARAATGFYRPRGLKYKRKKT